MDDLGPAAAAAGSAVEDDDPIVHEIPVYLSQELAHNLHLLQFPLRPAGRPYSDVGGLVYANFKPRLRKLQLGYQLTEGRSFNPDADFDMTELILSSRTVPPKSNYAIGLFKENKLYLTPLHATLRMLPSLDHIDRAEEEDRIDKEAQKDGSGEAAAGGAGASAGASLDDDMKPVTQKYKRKESERAPSTRRLTFAHLKLLQDQEPWLRLNLIDPADYQTSAHRDHLTMHPQSPVSPIGLASEYVSKLFPAREIFSDAAEADQTGTIKEKVIQTLTAAHILPFPVLCAKVGARTQAVVSDLFGLCGHWCYFIHGLVVGFPISSATL